MPPSRCSATVGVGGPTHGPNTFPKVYFLGDFSRFQFLGVIYCCFDTCRYEKHFSECRKFEARRGQTFPMPAHSPRGQKVLSTPQNIPSEGGSQVGDWKTFGLSRGPKMHIWPFEGSQVLVLRFSETLN